MWAMCTAWISRPANAMNVPTTSAMLDNPLTGGVRSPTPVQGIWFGWSPTSQANMKTISAAAGMIVPRTRPMFPIPADALTPRVTIAVASQNTTRMTAPMYAPLDARSGRPIDVARAAAPNDSNDGYSVTLFMNTNHVA